LGSLNAVILAEILQLDELKDYAEEVVRKAAKNAYGHHK
jgi:hypothetical protein